jgi:outer membrane receptor protein involved in Fe transport
MGVRERAGAACRLLAASGLCYHGAALAQPAAGGEASGGASDRIVVTGSRIARSGDAASPVVTIDAATLERAGHVPIIETLAQHPALLASSFGARTAGTEGLFDASGMTTLGRAGAAFLNLRGLGENRTLVLVNGRRHVAGYIKSAAVDINAIPTGLIEGLDVLTGGASAIYGADGVSGVVNFRLARNFDGFRARGQAGVSSRGDAGQRYGSLTFGRNFGGGRGNIALAYEYRAQDRVRSADRARTGDPARTYGIVRNPADFPDRPDVPDRIALNDLRYADSAVDGAVDLDMDRIPDFTGSGKVYDRGVLLPSSGGLAQGGDSTPLAGYQGDLQAGTHAHALNLLAHYDLGDAATLFLEAGYARNRAVTRAQPSFDFFTYLSPDNPYLQDRYAGVASTAQGALVTRDNYDLGVRGERNLRETLRFAGGAEGRLSDHGRYELSYTFGQTRSTIWLTDYRIADRYWAAIDAVRDPATGAVTCRSSLDPGAVINARNYGAAATSFTPGAAGGCRPLNLLGEGVRDPAALDWVNADIVNRARVRQHVVSGSLSGDFGQFFALPGGPVGFAIGAEYRREASRFTPDALLQQGALADFSLQLPEAGRFDVGDVFGELSAPLLKDVPFARELTLGAAVRLSDYSTVGRTLSWKVDGRWTPVPGMTLRGSWAQAVRAPNIAELFGPRNGGFRFITDPCDPVAIGAGTPYRAANCRATLSAAGLSPAQIAAFNPQNDPIATVSLPGFSGGNRNLREETARTWTAGMVLRPRGVPGLTATLDWYAITLKDAINMPSAEEIAGLCVDQPSLDNVYCGNITRAGGTGYISSWFVQPQNVARFRTSGADMTLTYRVDAGRLGVFALNLAGGYLHRLSFVPTPGAGVDVDRDEAYHPRWTATGDVTWTRGRLTVNYGLSWWSRTDRFTREELRADPDIAARAYLHYKAKWQHDLHVAWDVDDRFRFYIGATNLFDQQPSIASASYPVSFVGRALYAGARIGL